MTTCIFIETIKDLYLFWFCDERLFCKPLFECPIHCWALYHFKNLFSPPTSYYLFSFINILSIVISFASFIFFLHIYYYYDPFCFLVKLRVLWAEAALTQTNIMSYTFYCIILFENIPKKCSLFFFDDKIKMECSLFIIFAINVYLRKDMLSALYRKIKLIMIDIKYKVSNNYN